MATQEHVYMLWDCSDCGEKGILCSPDARFCHNCGHIRTFVEFDAAYLPGTDATWDEHDHHVIPDDVVARLMSAGASWFCTNCTADNYGDEDACHSCGATRKASDDVLREALDYKTFQAYMDGDRGATADLVQQFGEYAGMRASHGLSFDMDDAHEGQLDRAQQGRSAFKSEMNAETNHAARPEWDPANLPSSQESLERTHPERPALPDQHTRAKKLWRRIVLFLGSTGVLGVCGGGGAFVAWGTSTYEDTGEVTRVTWERQIQEQRWTPVVREGWKNELVVRDEIPPTHGTGERAGVVLQDCFSKHHHYEDYVCGTKSVPCTHMETYTESYSCTRQESYSESYSCTRQESYSCGENCSTSRGSNGMATRTCSPKYCTRSVSDTCTRTAYRDVPDTCTRSLQRPIHSSDIVDKICQRSIEATACNYATQHWVNSDLHSTNGEDKTPVWPEGSLDALEREQRSESFTISVAYSGAEEPFSATENVSRQLFDKWNVGDPVPFLVTNFGKVDSFSLTSAPPE